MRRQPAPTMEYAKVRNTDSKKITRPETAGRLMRNRGDCLKSPECKAFICPLEPRKANRKLRKNEVTCFFLKEAATAKGTIRTEHTKSPNQLQAEEAREIAGNLRRTYYTGSKGLLKPFLSDRYTLE